MDLKDLKDEIVAELGALSSMTVSECREHQEHPIWGAKSQEVIIHWVWDLHEDPNKNLTEESNWIAKEATDQKVGEVILTGTRIYFKPEISNEKMYLDDLIEPDSFDKAIVALKAALTVANICKTPNGMKLPPRPERPF